MSSNEFEVEEVEDPDSKCLASKWNSSSDSVSWSGILEMKGVRDSGPGSGLSSFEWDGDQSWASASIPSGIKSTMTRTIDYCRTYYFL